MSWLFSRALVVEYLGVGFSDGEPCAQLNVLPTPRPFWHKGKTMEYCDHSQFGQTLKLLTENHGADVLMSFLAAFHVRTSAAPERAPALMERVPDSGPRLLGLLAKWNHQQSYWKTAQSSLLEDSDVFSETWPRWGLMRAGECWEQEKSGSPINEIVSGYSLPTPSGVNGGNNHTMGRVDEWGGSSNPLRGTVIGSMCLPQFEEMVMGWPVMWTALTPYAMDKFHEWSLEHGKP